jgi:hypothetical protein
MKKAIRRNLAMPRFSIKKFSSDNSIIQIEKNMKNHQFYKEMR